MNSAQHTNIAEQLEAEITPQLVRGRYATAVSQSGDVKLYAIPVDTWKKGSPRGHHRITFEVRKQDGSWARIGRAALIAGSR